MYISLQAGSKDFHVRVIEEDRLTPTIQSRDADFDAEMYNYGEMENLAFYTEKYLDKDPPIHHFSGGDWYLIIPRYPDMAVELYRNDIETMGSELVYEDVSCGPFLIQCNISDIFPDATIRLTYQGETVEFSPYISLEDGSVQVGEQGLDITD